MLPLIAFLSAAYAAEMTVASQPSSGQLAVVPPTAPVNRLALANRELEEIGLYNDVENGYLERIPTADQVESMVPVRDYPEVCNLSDEVVKAALKAMESIAIDRMGAGFEPVANGRLFVREVGQQATLLIAYRPIILSEQLSPHGKRNVLLKQANTIWSALRPIIASKPSHQLLHVGQETAGSMACIMARRCLTSKHLPIGKNNKWRNSQNQVLVLTWNELPVFTKRTLLAYEVRAKNHLQIVSGKVEVAPFVSMGREVKTPWKLFKGSQAATRHLPNLQALLPKYTLDNASTSNPSATQALAALIKESGRIYEVGWQVYQKEGRPLFWSKAQRSVAALQADLNRFLFGDEQLISCIVLESTRLPSKKTKDITDNQITVQCNTINAPTTPVATFVAVKGRPSRREERLKRLQTIAGGEDDWKSGWIECMRDLGTLNLALGRLLPAPRVMPTPAAAFYEYAVARETGKESRGFFFRPVTSQQTLKRLHKHHPGLFFRMIDVQSASMPESCLPLFQPLLLDAEAQLNLQPLLNTAAAYLAEWEDALLHGPAQLPANQKPPFSVRFKAGTEQPPAQWLSSLQSIFTGLALNSAAPRDCQDAGNRWIPGACPAFCQAHPTEPLCRTVFPLPGECFLAIQSAPWTLWSRDTALKDVASRLEKTARGWCLREIQAQTGFAWWGTAKCFQFAIIPEATPRVVEIPSSNANPTTQAEQAKQPEPTKQNEPSKQAVNPTGNEQAARKDSEKDKRDEASLGKESDQAKKDESSGKQGSQPESEASKS